jgi:hypothetical protein
MRSGATALGSGLIAGEKRDVSVNVSAVATRLVETY